MKRQKTMAKTNDTLEGFYAYSFKIFFPDHICAQYRPGQRQRQKSRQDTTRQDKDHGHVLKLWQKEY